MDLERLNKTQIILLTLLVSFVTSIATGIATVSLMEKAPTDVTRVISRIIEQPIENITGGQTVVEERTVIVSEGEQVAKAVDIAKKSIVRIYTIEGKNNLEFRGMGVIVSAEGVVVADRRIVDSRERYVAILSDGTELEANPSETDTEQGFFRLESKTNEPLPALSPAAFSPFDNLVLGQSVIALYGDASTKIAPGVIAELIPSGINTVSSRLRASINGVAIPLGTPLIDLAGAIVGMPEDVGSDVFLTLRESAGE